MPKVFLLESHPGSFEAIQPSLEMNERMNGVNEWMNGVNEWMNGVNEWMNEWC